MSKIITFIIAAILHAINIVLLFISAVFAVKFPALTIIALIIGMILAAQDIKEGEVNG